MENDLYTVLTFPEKTVHSHLAESRGVRVKNISYKDAADLVALFLTPNHFEAM